jgi:predicted dehydrogenase
MIGIWKSRNAARKIHVMVEKPMAATDDEATPVRRNAR